MGFGPRIAQWASANKKHLVIVGAVVAGLLVVGLGWIVLPKDPTPITTAPETSPAAPVPQEQARDEHDTSERHEVDQDDHDVEVGPAEMPELDVSPEIAKFGIDKLAVIEPVQDPVEFAQQFAPVWMAPNYAAYEADEFTDWVLHHFSPNDVSLDLSQRAEVSIRDQVVPVAEWEKLTEYGDRQAAQVLSAEIPEWAGTTQARSYMAEAEGSGWAHTTLVEAYGVVYTKGKIDGKTPYDYTDLHRDIYAVKCDPYCGIADVLTPQMDSLGAREHGKDLDDFNLAGSDG